MKHKSSAKAQSSPQVRLLIVLIIGLVAGIALAGIACGAYDAYQQNHINQLDEQGFADLKVDAQ